MKDFLTNWRAPVAATNRIASLDVLRGFAVLGILLANIQDFASPTGILHDIPLDVERMTGKSEVTHFVAGHPGKP